MKKIIPLLIVLLSLEAYSQIIPITKNLDSSLTKTYDSALVYVKNPTNKLINITSFRVTSPFFFTRVSTFNVNPFDSTGIWVLFSSYQNLTYRSFLICEGRVPNGGANYSFIYGLIATAKYPDVMYAFTQGLVDEPLKAALKTFSSSPYTTLGYNTARDRMFETVDDYGGDTIECVYTGIKIYATNRTQAQNQGFNTEHTWPQSLFNSNDPMVSDIHHLFPTDDAANSARANYPFGFVVSNITWQVGGSKLGRDASNNIVFEPRDKHKGNVARSLFYFVLRHQNWGTHITAAHENALRQFHLRDTVDARERQRNDKVKQFQNNRNPFADHPEFVERIAAFYTTLNTPPKAEITASPYNARFDTLSNPNDTVSYFVAICNYGNSNLTVSSVTSNNPVFTVESFPSTVQPNQFGYARVKFTPSSANQTYTGELTINNADSTLKVNLYGVCGNIIGISQISNEVPNTFSLKQNYPNPFNPSTSIRFGIPSSASNETVSLKVFDAIGREVSTLVNSRLAAGEYEARFDASKFTSGIYFYRLSASGFTSVKRMVLVK